jgi:hypothetical protein
MHCAAQRERETEAEHAARSAEACEGRHGQCRTGRTSAGVRKVTARRNCQLKTVARPVRFIPVPCACSDTSVPEVALDHGFIEVGQLRAAACDPTQEIADQVEAPEAPVSIRGEVTDKNGPLEGAYVGAHGAGKTFTTYVMTDSRGEFTFRGLAPGSYAAFTKIPSFHKVEKDAITVQPGKEARADFQVEPESDFMTLVDQASNSELLESLPLPKAAVNALDSRCSSRCHGASYYLKARFDAKGWMLVVSKMESITPVADMNPPIMRPNRNGQEPPRRGSNTGTDKEISAQQGTIRLGGYNEIEVKGAAAFEGPTLGVGVRPIMSEKLVK